MTPSDSPAVSPSRRRAPWLIAGAVAVVAAAVVTLLLTTGNDDSGGDGSAADNSAAGDQPTGATSTPAAPPASDEPGSAYDLSTPEAAAKAFAAAAGTGSGDTLLDLACVGQLACVTEHVPGVTEEQLTESRNQLRDGVYELGDHLKDAEFGPATDGPEPGTKAVPYRTPAMTSDATLTFIQSEGNWLYYTPAG